MPVIKTSQFDQQQNALAKVCKALGHPARIAILQLLIKRRECVCNELVGQLPLAQATISQHLKVLKEAGLIKGEIAPHRSCYCIDPEGWQAAQQQLQGLFGGYVPPATAVLCCE